MRKIRHILQNMDKLKGEYEALMRCAPKQTLSRYNQIVDVMNRCPDIGTLKHTQPSHYQEIARLAPKKEWPEWVERCEKDELTVVKLRSEFFVGGYQPLHIMTVRPHLSPE